jgi:hypothetical protein
MHAAEEEGNRSGLSHEANGDFKTVTEFNGCHRRKIMMDQQHCSYSTILLIDRVKRRKPVQITIIPKHASCLQQGTKVILQKMWQSN